ncbi:MAG: cadherin-like domain-containing protein [Acidobacteria bacterium]|nr:cadherin-like domain-containing protein [Acidobacteriota bacterium]
MRLRVPVQRLMFALLITVCSSAQSLPVATRQVSLGERIACQSAIEQVYWQHRVAPGVAGPTLSFAEAVPREVIDRKAEDAVLESMALQRFWNVTVGGEQLQAELNRMAAHTKSPDILAELFAAVGNDPLQAAECLARPALTERLIQSYYGSDARFHGDLKSRALSELASGAAHTGSGHYTEMEWHRGRDLNAKRGAIGMEPATFDERVRELKQAVGGTTGSVTPGRFSTLREDSHRFYAISVLSIDETSLRVATVEWAKVPFETWWMQTRQELPLQLAGDNYSYAMPVVAPNGNCRDDSWKPTLQLVDARYWHTAVWTGSEMIVWGGMAVVGVNYNDGTRYNPATDTYAPVAMLGAPSARAAHSAVWSGKEMVIFGGTGDRTGGRYDPVTDTWTATRQLGAPIGQQYGSVVWTGKEMIVWGGIIDVPVHTGGRYNPTTNKWKAMAPAPLAGRAYMPAVWTGTEMIVWSGYDVTMGQMYQDGARYNPTTNTWKQTNPAGAPNARYWHSAVWTGTEMIVWGGTVDTTGGRYNPLTDTWRPTSLANAPSLRWTHSAVWTGSVMVIQGGAGSDPVGGIYDPVTNQWTRTSAINAIANGEGASAVWTNKEMIVWGGLDQNFSFHNDGGRYNPSTNSWLRTATMNVPHARGLHSGEWTGSEMVIWGSFYAVGGRYDPATDNWKTTSTVGAPPVRENATSVWTGTEVIFWGGEPDGNPFTAGSGGRYNPVTDSWKLVKKTNAPFTTYGHTAVWTGTEMIVYGGISSSLNAKRYKPSTDTWANATMVNDPGHRDHHAAVWTGKEMVVWGGSIDSGFVGPEGGRYNPTTDTWTSMSASGIDAPRMWPVGIWTGTEAIFWGGHDQLFGRDYNDGGRYNPQTNSWTLTNLANAPTPRVAQGVWTGKEMIVWGGANNPSGGRYTPASDSWQSTTLLNAPAVRYGGRWSTVWTGNQMIIWGGIEETQQGSLYCASGQPNIAPLGVDDAYVVKSAKKVVFGTARGVLTNDTDSNGDPLTAKIVSKATHGTLTFNANGSFIYKSAKGYVGTDSFMYQANDGLANSNVATVNVTVQ